MRNTRTGSSGWKSGLLGLLLLSSSLLIAGAEEVLFIGNSLTFGGSDAAVAKYGGVPKLVEAIAVAKGKSLSTRMVTSSGKDWRFHLENPATDKALKSKTWDDVVLQDYSLKETHVTTGDFMKDGLEFDQRIAASSPKARIILYQTWAYGPKHELFKKGQSSPKSFANPAEMMGEIEKNYAILQHALQTKNPKREVLLAPVGIAFALAQQEHPELDLWVSDSKHASTYGSYLAALVIYATIFHDSPIGATATFPGFTLKPDEAKALQTAASDVFK